MDEAPECKYDTLQEKGVKDDITQKYDQEENTGDVDNEMVALGYEWEDCEDELIEDIAEGQIIQGEDGELYLMVDDSVPEIDVDRLESVQMIRNNDGTETIVFMIDEESIIVDGKDFNSYQIVQVLDEDGKYHYEQRSSNVNYQNNYESIPMGMKYRRNRIHGLYTCSQCGATFVNTARLERHLAVHQASGAFLCPLCQKVYKYEYNLFYHWRKTCTELKESVSPEERKDLDVNALRKLVNMLAKKKMANAKPAVMRFGINRNILFKTTASGPIDMQAPLRFDDVRSSVPCQFCGIVLLSSLIPIHVAMHRNEVAVDARTSFGEHFCSLCGQVFRQHYNLIKHWRTGCPEILEHLPHGEDLTMDDNGLKTMVVSIMQQFVDERSESNRISQEVDCVGTGADLFASPEKIKFKDHFDDYQLEGSSRLVGSEALDEIDSRGLRNVGGSDDQRLEWSSQYFPYTKELMESDELKADSNVRYSVEYGDSPQTKYSCALQCPECSRTFVNQARLDRHIAGYHATFGDHHCLLCGNRFKYDYNLLFHYRRSCPYTKIFIDHKQREQLDAAALRKIVRGLAQKDLNLSPTQRQLLNNDTSEGSSHVLRYPMNHRRPPIDMVLPKSDLPNGRSCPICGVVFYANNGVEKHLRAVHPLEFMRYQARRVRRKQPISDLPQEKKMNPDLEEIETPPTLAPEVTHSDGLPTTQVKRISRIEIDEEGNQLFYDESGNLIDLADDQQFEIHIDDYSSVQQLIESGHLAVPEIETEIMETGDKNLITEECQATESVSNEETLSADQVESDQVEGRSAVQLESDLMTRKPRKQKFQDADISPAKAGAAEVNNDDLTIISSLEKDKGGQSYPIGKKKEKTSKQIKPEVQAQIIKCSQISDDDKSVSRENDEFPSKKRRRTLSEKPKETVQRRSLRIASKES